MESEKPNSFEQEWQKAFNDASFSPPSDMWDRIERELEEKKRRPFLFFMRPSVISAGVAAALILVLGGIFYLNKNSSDKTNLAENTSLKANTKKTTLKTTSNTGLEANINIQDKTSTTTQPTESSSTESQSTNRNGVTNTALAFTGNTPTTKNSVSRTKSIAGSTEKYTQNNLNSMDNFEQNSNIPSTPFVNKEISNESVVLAENNTEAVFNLNLLKKKEYQYFGSRYTLYRNKLAFDNNIEEAPILASNDSKFWVGVQSGVAPFDPNMKLNGLNAVAFQQAEAFAQTSNNMPSNPNLGAMPSTGDKQGNVVVSQPQNAIKAGVGTNTGIAFGYKIAKKWNLESGIRYLRGNSTLQTNTYNFQQNGYANTFLGDYLLQNSSNAMKVSNSATNTVVADASQFGNRYEYLMIPMQLGYEIGLTKKLGLNLLAGVSADVFLQNIITNDNSILQEKSIINSSNNVYKPLNMSGLGGIRANYLINKHWQAILGSSFQQSLFSGINSSTVLQMRLKIFGLNYGVNYRF